jgi:hypothetical protein
MTKKPESQSKAHGSRADEVEKLIATLAGANSSRMSEE